MILNLLALRPKPKHGNLSINNATLIYARSALDAGTSRTAFSGVHLPKSVVAPPFPILWPFLRRFLRRFYLSSGLLVEVLLVHGRPRVPGARQFQAAEAIARWSVQVDVTWPRWVEHGQCMKPNGHRIRWRLVGCKVKLLSISVYLKDLADNLVTEIEGFSRRTC